MTKETMTFDEARAWVIEHVVPTAPEWASHIQVISNGDVLANGLVIINGFVDHQRKRIANIGPIERMFGVDLCALRIKRAYKIGYSCGWQDNDEGNSYSDE